MGNGDNVNSIVAEALQKAGVRPADISVLPEPGKSVEPSVEPVQPAQPGKPNLDGTLKEQVKGAPLGDREPVVEPKVETPEPLEPGTVEPVEQKPLTVTEITDIISQASSQFQSIMDKKIFALQTQTQGIINALNQYFESQENAGLSGLPEGEQVQKRLERLEGGTKGPRIQVNQPVEQQPITYYQQMVNFVNTVGMRIDDKRIDWAGDTNDPKVGFDRFLVSIKTALTEDQTKAIKGLKDDGDKEIAKVRKKVGVDRVNTVGPSGKGLPDIEKMTPLEKLTFAYDQAAVLAQHNQ